MRKTPFIGFFIFRLLVDVFSGKPVELVSVWIGVFTVFVVPSSATSDSKTHLYGCAADIGYVDVKAYVFGQSGSLTVAIS